jgi:GH15 family glucan-1,4-alpha-glucosidase
MSNTVLVTGTDEDERLLRERRPNGVNTSEFLTLMNNTREAWRSWIEQSMPTISDVIQRYPRQLDLNSALCNIVN